jgi:DNA-binding MarR family transcriptional regulator
MLSRKISRVYDDAVRPYGLRFSQMNILTVVAVREPITPTEVGRVLELEKSTLSRNLARMAANGWIESQPADGGGQLLRITSAGHERLAAASDGWREAQDRVEAMLGRQTVERIRRAVDRQADPDT